MELNTDVLIAGSGLSGILLALELAKERPDCQITIISSLSREKSSSFLAQGGIAASLPENEAAVKQHVSDTLAAGAGTNNLEVVEYGVNQSARVIRHLEEWGVIFDKTSSGKNSLALEGGHSIHRILHHKDFTGKHIMEVLFLQLGSFPNIQILENTELLDVAAAGSKLSAAIVWDSTRQCAGRISYTHLALATGGVGQLFRYTTNPATATGSAIAIAMKIGAPLAGLHYIQFHPTALWGPKAGRLSLISEAVRGAGAILRNEKGDAFMERAHPLRDLAPRDVVSRAIISELHQQNLPYAFLDCRHIPAPQFAAEFPSIVQICAAAGINPAQNCIPVVPVAHYSCGGIATDITGNCNVEGISVIGEAACTGFHGANRLASNSLLEACVMSLELAQQLSTMAFPKKTYPSGPGIMLKSSAAETLNYNKLLGQVQSVMHRHCYVVKTNNGLAKAKLELTRLQESKAELFSPASVESYKATALLDASTAIIEFATRETRNTGVFYNSDLAAKPVKLCI